VEKWNELALFLGLRLKNCGDRSELTYGSDMPGLHPPLGWQIGAEALRLLLQCRKDDTQRLVARWEDAGIEMRGEISGGRG
jgi:hypothetical protein